MKKGQEPAFPQPFKINSNDETFSSKNLDFPEEISGISTRLYIATKAMQGFTSNHLVIREVCKLAEELKETPEELIAIKSFAIADAMLEEESK